MATRFHLPHPSGAPAAPVSPTFDAAWEQTNEATRFKIQTRKVNTPKATGTSVTETSTNSSLDVLRLQGVSAPLRAQTISGTVKGMIPCQESNASADARAQLGIRVVSNDGTTVRGTLRALDGASLSSEFTTTAAPYEAKKYPQGWTGAGATLTDVDAQEGDRLVFEIGARFHNSSASSFLARWMLGDDVSLSDTPETEGDTTGIGWLELSQDLEFAADYTVTTDSIDATTYPGTTYLQAIDDAGVSTDVLYLAAGTYTGGSYAQTTTRSKYLRVRPADGVSRDEVLLQGFGSSPWFTNANWVSFENVTFTGSTKFQGHHVQFVGCRNKSGMQIMDSCHHITVQGCRMGGDDAASALAGTVIATTPSAVTEPKIRDVWILGNDLAFISDNDAMDLRHFDHIVIEDNVVREITHPGAGHPDGIRTFLGGTYLVLRRNLFTSGIASQGFFINGGAVDDILVENNLFGTAAGSFRAFAIDDNTNRLRVINNSFQEGGSFSGSSTHVHTVMFNNAFEAGDSIAIVAGTTVGWAYRDYNYLGEIPTGITPAANEPVDGVTFTDATNGDFSLTGSNGVNFGVASAIGYLAPTTDYTGAIRTFPCEAGAIER